MKRNIKKIGDIKKLGILVLELMSGTFVTVQ